MNNQNGATSSQPPPHRPPYPHQNSSYRNDYGIPNGRPSPVSAQSPPSVSFGSPPPQFSPTYGQPPAAKRPRLSPDITSPFSNPNYPPTPVGGVNSHGSPVNGTSMMPPRQGSMPPPQRPAERPEKRGGNDDYNDALTGAGINLDEENRELARADYFGGINSRDSSFGRSMTNGQLQSMHIPGSDNQTDGPAEVLTEEERKRRTEERADWEASRQTQNPLWDMFLYGGNLNEKIRKTSLNEHLVDPQSGVLVNTQRNAPPPTVRVNGLEGATRVIDRGQAILDTGPKADRLGEIMKLVCLATKTRLTGLLNSSARLAIERRQHSKGKVPTEWEDIAAVPKSVTEPDEGDAASNGSNALKPTHSQANDEGSVLTGPDRIAITLQKIAQAEKAAEEAHRAKRAKRKAAAAGTVTPATAEQAVEADVQAAIDEQKKTSKKEQNKLKRNISEQQAHQASNRAAQMAVSGTLGKMLGGKKGKTYGWMNLGDTSGASSPRPLLSTNTSAVGTPTVSNPRSKQQDRRFGIWDEDKDPGVQAKDVLLVLETDGRAPRAYLRGTNNLDS